jgi:hypothetical protein
MFQKHSSAVSDRAKLSLSSLEHYTKDTRGSAGTDSYSQHYIEVSDLKMHITITVTTLLTDGLTSSLITACVLL